MLPTPAHCFEALAARDARFDGTFFVGVTTTGIYCRPVCPARTPRADRCRFFASAAAAERRGFRPCLRCRPELAPHAPVALPAVPVAPVDAMRVRARLAGARIASGALDEGSLDGLAHELGVSGRHLRRSVERELGASPVALAQTRRLLTAKQLLTESSLPMTQVAMASGFGSVRRFNALFRSRYVMAPSDLRRHRCPATDMVRLALGVRPPFDWPALCEFLERRATPGVEGVTRADGRPTYWRTVRIGNCTGVVGVGSGDANSALRVQVDHRLLPALVPLLARLRHLLDLDAMPHRIAEHLGRDPMLAGAVARSPGRRVPGAVDAFELAVRAILGQQVSVRGATTLAGRLVATCAEPLELADAVAPPGLLTHAPLCAERLADASLAQIAAIGLPRARAECLQQLARTVAEGGLRALRDPALAALDGDAEGRAFEREFRSLPGVGPWTAQYVAMRALRLPDAFPDGDLVLRRRAGALTPAQLRARAERWRPWRAYAAMHLWASAS